MDKIFIYILSVSILFLSAGITLGYSISESTNQLENIKYAMALYTRCPLDQIEVKTADSNLWKITDCHDITYNLYVTNTNTIEISITFNKN